MKQFYCLVLLSLSLTGVNAQSFKIKGEIQGLVPGDTLYFDKVTLPNYDYSDAFWVVVQKPNEFSYQGQHDHTTLYRMRYQPVSGEKVESFKTGNILLIKDQETVLTGNTQQIYNEQIKGGLYENKALQEILKEENLSYGKIGEATRLLAEAKKDQDQKAIEKYTLELQTLNQNFSLEYFRIDSLYQKFYQAFPSSAHTVVETFKTSGYKPYEFSLSRYQNMDSSAKESYFGKALKQQLDILEKLQPGAAAPDFELTAVNGTKVSLKDFKGSYVLLYHWGICPGSFTRENEIVEFQNQFKDKVVVIGITDSLLDIEEFLGKTTPKTTVQGMQVQPLLRSMLNHPWLEVEKIPANKQMLMDYPFVSLPAFVLISPQGKIISRGSHPTFFKAKEILESESASL